MSKKPFKRSKAINKLFAMQKLKPADLEEIRCKYMLLEDIAFPSPGETIFLLPGIGANGETNWATDIPNGYPVKDAIEYQKLPENQREISDHE